VLVAATRMPGNPSARDARLVALFGLTHNATQSEIKDAYRTLAKVWHPDRFPGDEQLRRKAEEKLKEINSAYGVLTTTADEIPRRNPSRPEQPQANPAAASAGEPQQPASVGPPFPAMHRVRARRAGLILMLAIGGIWFTLRFGHSAISQLETATGAAASAAREMADRPANGAAASHVSSWTTQPSKQKPAANARTAAAASGHASLLVYPAEDPRAAYFTVGSSKNDVLRVQGTPTRIAANAFAYGRSKVYFKDGRVQSWRQDPGSPLRAQLP